MSRDNYNEYMREYMLERYYRRRADAIAQLGGVCIDCGTDENLEFDHAVAADKTLSVGKAFTSMSTARLNAELEKCVLRCKPCHLTKSRREDFNTVEHGGGVSGKKNCYCELCAPLKREYQRLNRKGRKQ